jgi:AraC family transcriptional regulator of adaptative response/methylated-DNA-[protein]-cysteine methyltransferase
MSAPETSIVADDIRWQAVADRDPRFNGTFVYAVNTTGVYCRPSCPSRRPHRENVVFFSSIDQAKRNGFRECLRCGSGTETASDPKVELTMKICKLLEANVDVPYSLGELSTQLGVSPFRLQRVFKSVTGVTPKQYSAGLRMEQFKANIRNGDDVTESLYMAGYGSSSRLYESAHAKLGMTPATYRKGGKGMSISFTITDSYLGRLLVARTDRGVCSIAFGESDSVLASALESEYPHAVIRHDKNGLRSWVSAVLDHLNGTTPNIELPLDLQATSFQLLVWEELRRIPFGETRSYAEIAARLGRPHATRAVARACASNPVALVTPCHRVVRSDGTLSGYRWGTERKRKLLEQEKKRIM